MKNLFDIASLLTDPLCKAREKYWLGKALGKNFYLQTIGYFVIGIIAAPFGAMIRYVAKSMQPKPYLCISDKFTNKVNNSMFSLFTWNVCGISGGYSITDGGVFPWEDRMISIGEKIHQQNADVVCLMEVFDMRLSNYLISVLKSSYSHFYYNISPQAVGISSGFFIASKLLITDFKFIRFPKEYLVGRTKKMAKGVVQFTVGKDVTSTQIFLTHLQHSEECEFPTTEEIIARESQMGLIMNQIENSGYRRVILTGDLNMDEVELENTSWFHRFDRGMFPHEETWGGDEFCAHLVNKKVSGPRTYDYTLMLRGGDIEIDSSYVETGYDPSVFSKNALSDHKGIMTAIKTRD